jgi:hypothetical protein
MPDRLRKKKVSWRWIRGNKCQVYQK